MVNTPAAQFGGAQTTGALPNIITNTSGHTPVHSRSNNNRSLQRNQNPAPHTLHSDDLEFLTLTEKQASITAPWRQQLKHLGYHTVDRLYVTADGSCAGGAFMLARADPAVGDISIQQARSPQAIRELRCDH